MSVPAGPIRIRTLELAVRVKNLPIGAALTLTRALTGGRLFHMWTCDRSDWPPGTLKTECPD